MSFISKIQRFITSKNELLSIDHARKKSDEIVVSFTGGMGAQIMSAAIYFDLQQQGYKVTADLKYFDQTSIIAIEGKKDEISLWDWQLDEYAIPLNMFVEHNPQKIFNIKYLSDGAEKNRLAMLALKKPEIQKNFPLEPLEKLLSYTALERTIHSVRFLCIHIRRGDYVNVASYLVPDNAFIQISQRFSHLVNSLVVVSDSHLDVDIKKQISKHFSETVWLDSSGVSSYVTHGIMRHAAILLCSNSQFSLTAGVLNSGLVILPKKWLGRGHVKLKDQIDKLSNFVLLD